MEVRNLLPSAPLTRLRRIQIGQGAVEVIHAAPEVVQKLTLRCFDRFRTNSGNGVMPRKVCSEELGEGGVEGGRRRWVRGGAPVGGATLGGR